MVNRKKVLVTAGVLAVALGALLMAPRLWCAGQLTKEGFRQMVPSRPILTGEESAEPEEESITPPYETRYFALALDYMAGKDVPAARGLYLPDPLITAEPTGCDVQPSVDYDYDPIEDFYDLPIMKMPDMEMRPISMVICDFDEYPYSIEVAIDTSQDRVAQWWTGKR